MIDLSTKPFEHLLLWSCWKTAYVLLYLHIYAIYPIHFLLLCANVCYCALYCASVHHFVLFQESSVPQKGPCGIHINGQFVTFRDLALCVADKKTPACTVSASWLLLHSKIPVTIKSAQCKSKQ